MLTSSELPLWQLVVARFRLSPHTDHGQRHRRTVLRNGFISADIMRLTRRSSDFSRCSMAPAGRTNTPQAFEVGLHDAVGPKQRHIQTRAMWACNKPLRFLNPLVSPSACPSDRQRKHQSTAMNPSAQKTLPDFAGITRGPILRSRSGSQRDFFQERSVSRVISDAHAMFDLLSSAPCNDRCRSDQLVNAVISAFVQGDLKPGDPFPEPSELARACHMFPDDVLAAIGFLLSRHILQQDRSGALRIHRRAAPTIEMKQQAFLACARQLVGQARQWHLPADCLDPLFHQAAHENP